MGEENEERLGMGSSLLLRDERHVGAILLADNMNGMMSIMTSSSAGDVMWRSIRKRRTSLLVLIDDGSTVMMIYVDGE